MRRSLALLVAFVLMATYAGFANEQDTTSLKGKIAPDITLKTLAGKQVKLSDQKNKVVILDIWATWCPPCRKSLPHIQELHANKELADKGLVVWAINSQETPATVNKFVKDNKFTFTVPMDAKGDVGQEYMVRGIPTTVIVGRDGTVKEVFIGFGAGSAAKIDAAIEKALDEK